MTIKVDGREVAKLPVPYSEWGRFTKGTVPFPLTAGPHEVRLEYSVWDLTSSDRTAAVLFEELRVSPK